jgi:hypothetical protein
MTFLSKTFYCMVRSSLGPTQISGASPTLVKLDRVFCSIEWEDQFPDWILQSEATEDSDHYPLKLGLNDGHPKRRFRFKSFWPKFEGFQSAVQSAWTSVQAFRCPLETLSIKLKATTKSLQNWSDTNVGEFYQPQAGYAPKRSFVPHVVHNCNGHIEPFYHQSCRAGSSLAADLKVNSAPSFLVCRQCGPIFEAFAK